jgi:membrane-bound lytic murein transglycosylase B
LSEINQVCRADFSPLYVYHLFFYIQIGNRTGNHFCSKKDAGIKDRVAVDKFITKMVEEHQFDQVELAVLFDSVELQPKIIAAMTRPAEGMPWYKYRNIFIHDSRIQGGVKFWQDNQQMNQLLMI